jgi:preprotein translocase subunit SecF
MLPLLCLLIYIYFRFTMTFALGFTMVKSMGGDIP